MPDDSPGFFSFLDHFTFVEDDSSSYEIGIGDEGFSYLDRVSEKKARQITLEEKQRRQTSAALDGSTRAGGKLNIRKMETIDHDAISLDTTLEHIIHDFQDRKKKIALFPIALVTTSVLFLVWCFLPDWFARFLVGILLFPGAFLALWNSWKLDISRRHAKLTYRFTGDGHAAFQAINQGFERLAASEQLLLLMGRRHFEDTRYSGGSASLPDLKAAQLDRRAPPLIEMDSPVWHIRSDRRDFYFMPDHVMVYDGANIGGIGYSKLEVRSSLDTTQAQGIAKRTRDCTVVGTTYRFVNNDGSPDRRFNNNIEIPLVEYGVFCMSGSGLDVNLYASQQHAGTSASRGFDAIQRIARKPVVPVAEARRLMAARKPNECPDIFTVLLNAMCCIMASDGRVSSSEKVTIKKIMTQVKSPFPPERVDQRVAEFCQRVKQQGFADVVESACEDAKIFKEKGKTDILLSCIETVAKADGVIQDSERQLVERFRTVVN
jgi:tellurite resistance protein